MSDLIKLDNIRKRNGDIRAFVLSSNFKSASIGKNGWGYVTIAINNESVRDLFDDNLIGVLYLVSKDEWEKEKQP